MNYKMVGFVLGRIFLIEAALMLFPMGCAAIYGEWSVVLSFLWPALIVLALGLITSLRTPQNTKIYARDGLAIVALVWVLMSVFGALPFVISGEIPSFADAFFETVSGFTTTGSTILTDVEALSHGTLFWRSFSHWIGGMGVLVFAMAVLPMTDVVTSYYLRIRVADEAGVLAKITTLLANAGISIDAVIQREADEVGGEGSNQTDLIILTHDTREGDMDKALAEIQGLPTVLAPITRIRKEELN